MKIFTNITSASLKRFLPHIQTFVTLNDFFDPNRILNSTDLSYLSDILPIYLEIPVNQINLFSNWYFIDKWIRYVTFHISDVLIY